jgi:hypothetical protein
MIGIVEPLSYRERRLVTRQQYTLAGREGAPMGIEESSENLPSLAETDESTDLSPNLNSVAIQRLIEEVSSSDSVTTSAHYNRTHNRHNR